MAKCLENCGSGVWHEKLTRGIQNENRAAIAKTPALLARMSVRASDALEVHRAKLELLCLELHSSPLKVVLTADLIAGWKAELRGAEVGVAAPSNEVSLCSFLDELESEEQLVRALINTMVYARTHTTDALKKAKANVKRLTHAITKLQAQGLAEYVPTEPDRVAVASLRRRRYYAELTEQRTLLFLLDGTFKRYSSSNDHVHNFERKAQRRRIESVKASIAVLEQQLPFFNAATPADESSERCVPELTKLTVVDSLDGMLRSAEELELLVEELRGFTEACCASAFALEAAAAKLHMELEEQSKIDAAAAHKLGRAAQLLHLAQARRALSAVALATDLAPLPQLSGIFARDIFTKARSPPPQPESAPSAIGNAAPPPPPPPPPALQPELLPGPLGPLSFRPSSCPRSSRSRSRSRSRSLSRSPSPERYTKRAPTQARLDIDREKALLHAGIVGLDELIALARVSLSTSQKTSAMELLADLPDAAAQRVTEAWENAEIKDDDSILNSFPFGFGGGSIDFMAKHLWRLSPAGGITDKWLHDETVDIFMRLVGLENDTSLFLDSHFVPKIMEEDGDWRQRWRQRHGNVLRYKHIFIPVNVDSSHWFLIVVYVREKRIQCYESFGKLRTIYLTRILEALKVMYTEADWSGWTTCEVEIYNTAGGLVTPQQHNGYDCGVFTCMSARYIARGLPLLYSEECMLSFRKRMTLALISYDSPFVEKLD